LYCKGSEVSPRVDVAEARRMQIIQAARACFARKGYHRTTMDDIVRESGLSKGSIYWYFESKKALFMAMLDAWLEQVDRSLSELVGASLPTAEKLRQVAQVLVTIANSSREMVPILLDFWAETSHDPQITQRLAQVYAEYRCLLRRIVQEGIASGELRPLDVDQVATILCGIYNGLMLQWVLEPEAVPWSVVADTLIELLLHGLQSEPGRDKRSR